MRIRALVDATVGRSLHTRIWSYGLVLFLAVLGLNVLARFGMPRFAPNNAVLVLHVALLVMAAFGIAFASALPLARYIARPLGELGRLARTLGDGNLAARAPADGRDEIADLARSFNRMAGDIQRLRNAERQLLADVSHELRTPLARMRVVLDLAAHEGGDADPAASRRYLREIATDLSELEELLGDIIVSSRLDPEAAHWTEARPPLRLERVVIADVASAIVERFASRWPARALTCRGDTGAEVDADPVLLRRAVENLVDNARKYSADDAPIELVSEASAAEVTLTVVDHGVGIRAEDQPLLMTPFFRADRSRSRATGGVGLGLTLARRIALAHGGRLGFESAVGTGSRFWITVPRAGQGPNAPTVGGDGSSRDEPPGSLSTAGRSDTSTP